jgi:Xaa-Pro aminopeptidase
MTAKHFRLVEIEWPEFGLAERPPPPPLDEFESRIQAARMAMAQRKLTHLIVYGDREHFANLTYLTGFDPRFEEALLIIDGKKTPLLVVGNECESYLHTNPLFKAGKLRGERFQPFSLLNQPREDSPFIRDIFASEGIAGNAQVGCVGWKYFGENESPAGRHAIEIPAYLVDSLRNLVGGKQVVNATDIFMHPDYGLRSFCTPSEIAYFEYTNILASEGIKRMLWGLREGMIDYELMALAQYSGEPLGCHWTLLSDPEQSGLTSPVGNRLRRGNPLSTNVCYWGANSCRAGWIASSAADLPWAAREYAKAFAGPYFAVMNEWFTLLRIGTPGDKFARLIEEKLPSEKYGIYLNPGHLIHLDEWVSSPIYPGSEIPIHSGMVMQVDVIPASDAYFSTRMEDGVVIADQTLRQQLRQQYPACYARCQKRRDFMTDVLGIELPEEVLPLSNIPAIVPPFFLSSNTVFAMEQ